MLVLDKLYLIIIIKYIVYACYYIQYEYKYYYTLLILQHLIKLQNLKRKLKISKKKITFD